MLVKIYQELFSVSCFFIPRRFSARRMMNECCFIFKVGKRQQQLAMVGGGSQRKQHQRHGLSEGRMALLINAAPGLSTVVGSCLCVLVASTVCSPHAYSTYACRLLMISWQWYVPPTVGGWTFVFVFVISLVLVFFQLWTADWPGAHLSAMVQHKVACVQGLETEGKHDFFSKKVVLRVMDMDEEAASKETEMVFGFWSSSCFFCASSSVLNELLVVCGKRGQCLLK